MVAGEQIHVDENLSEKKRKKLAAREAKKARDQLVSKMVKGAEDALGAFADMTEMFTKWVLLCRQLLLKCTDTPRSALSPPTCYPDSYSRFKIAGAFVVVPLFALHMVPAWMVARGSTFAFGVGMWGQPILIRASQKALEYLPDNWQDLIDIRKYVLASRCSVERPMTLSAPSYLVCRLMRNSPFICFEWLRLSKLLFRDLREYPSRERGHP